VAGVGDDRITTPVYCPRCEGDGCPECDDRGWRWADVTRKELREMLGITDDEEATT